VSVCIFNSIQTILTLSFSTLSWLSVLLATMAPTIRVLKVVPDGGGSREADWIIRVSVYSIQMILTLSISMLP
jgi:hypothetical protein